MDTIIKIISDDKKEYIIGASKFGYDDLTLQAVYILINLISHANVSDYEKSFLETHFKLLDHDCHDIDIVIDNVNEKVSLFNGFEIVDVEKEKADLADCKKVDFDDIDIFLKEVITYEQFFKLYYFFIYNLSSPYLLINDRFLLHFTRHN